MTGFLKSLIEGYEKQLERNRNHPFLRAVMAGAALVATADGKVNFTERARLDQVLETLEALNVFDPKEGVELFVDYAEDILENPKRGHAKAIKALDAVADSSEQASLLIRVCLAISAANGDLGLADQIEIVSLCTRLGLEPAEFGLYSKEVTESLQGDSAADD